MGNKCSVDSFLMPRVCEYLYHKGANTLCFYRLTIAGGANESNEVGFPSEQHMYTQVHLERSPANLHLLAFLLFFLSHSSLIIYFTMCLECVSYYFNTSVKIMPVKALRGSCQFQARLVDILQIKPATWILLGLGVNSDVLTRTMVTGTRSKQCMSW